MKTIIFKTSSKPWDFESDYLQNKTKQNNPQPPTKPKHNIQKSPNKEQPAIVLVPEFWQTKLHYSLELGKMHIIYSLGIRWQKVMENRVRNPEIWKHLVYFLKWLKLTGVGFPSLSLAWAGVELLACGRWVGQCSLTPGLLFFPRFRFLFVVILLPLK